MTVKIKCSVFDKIVILLITNYNSTVDAAMFDARSILASKYGLASVKCLDGKKSNTKGMDRFQPFKRKVSNFDVKVPDVYVNWI